MNSTSPYLYGYKIDEVVKNVEDDCATLVIWFSYTFLTLNADKFHLPFTKHIFENMFARVNDATIWEEGSKE